jgi:DNA-binding IscR family transcriptional regulator
MVECAAQPGQCDQESICPARVNWSRINLEIERALERIPISEMVTEPARELLAVSPSPANRSN